jgi:hypothetical protein
VGDELLTTSNTRSRSSDASAARMEEPILDAWRDCFISGLVLIVVVRMEPAPLLPDAGIGVNGDAWAAGGIRLVRMEADPGRGTGDG